MIGGPLVGLDLDRMFQRAQIENDFNPLQLAGFTWKAHVGEPAEPSGSRNVPGDAGTETMPFLGKEACSIRRHYDHLGMIPMSARATKF